MKKISIFTILSVLSVPALAEESTTTDIAPVTADAAVVATPVVPDAQPTETGATLDDTTLSEPMMNEDAVIADQEKMPFWRGFQIGAGISATGGLNGFVGYANKDFDSFWAKRFGVRLDFATTRPIRTVISDGIESIMGDEGIDIGDGLSVNDITLSAKHFAAMLDFYPFGDTWFLGGWRLTGGYYMGDMQATAKIAGELDGVSGDIYEFELNGTQFRYMGNSVHGSAEFNWDYRGPYIGTGFDIGLFAGLKIYLDAGVVFTNRAAELGLDVPFAGLEINQNGTWESVEDNNLQSVVDDIIADTLSDAQSDLDDLKFYPIVKLGFMYRF